MRVGVFHARKYYLRNVESALEALVGRGHEVVVATPERKAKARYVPRALEGRVGTAQYPHDRDRSLGLVRAVRDALRYEVPPLRDAHANRARAWRKLARAYSDHAAAAAPHLELADDDVAAIDRIFDAIEAIVPPDAGLVEFIRALGLDAAVVVSRVNFGTSETGVVRAARAAGVPTGVVVYSWDNLSSKARVHERPDRLFVWNDVMAQEAVELHGLQPAEVEAVGAPRFDVFFDLEPSAPREELLAGWGLDPARKTVLYLGSSGFVSKREPEVIDDWLAAVRAASDANVIMRPHPGVLDEPVWQGWRPQGERVAMPVPRRREQDLLDQLAAADAVVALNTSAEIEAAIAGRPVLTFSAGDLAPGQGGSAHFRYLLARDGGFAEHAASIDEHVPQLLRALELDPHAAQRRAFVERFVRPAGLDRRAGDVLAERIEALGQLVQVE